MTNLDRQLDAEVRMRALLEDGDLPQPDEVEYGETCIRLIWWEQRLAVVIDLEEEEDTDPGLESAPAAG